MFLCPFQPDSRIFRPALGPFLFLLLPGLLFRGDIAFLPAALRSGIRRFLPVGSLPGSCLFLPVGPLPGICLFLPVAVRFGVCPSLLCGLRLLRGILPVEPGRELLPFPVLLEFPGALGLRANLARSAFPGLPGHFFLGKMEPPPLHALSRRPLWLSGDKSTSFLWIGKKPAHTLRYRAGRSRPRANLARSPAAILSRPPPSGPLAGWS